MVFVGLYSSLEDTWYNMLDKIGRVFPIYKVVDPIDEVIPSFLLFILVVILLVAGGVYFLFFAGSTITPPDTGAYNVSLTIKDSNSIIVGALVEAKFTCADGEEKELLLTSNVNGKVEFVLCAEDVSIIATKEGYDPLQLVLVMPDDEVTNLTLSKTIHFSKQVNVKVVDESKTIITNSKLDLICVATGESTRTAVTTALSGNKQPTSGFELDAPATVSYTHLTLPTIYSV